MEEEEEGQALEKEEECSHQVSNGECCENEGDLRQTGKTR